MFDTKKFLTAGIAMTMLAGCGSAASTASSTGGAEAFYTQEEITVISREDGSGTRGAFVELTGVEEKNAEGKKVDRTTAEAQIVSSTSVVLTTVANDAYGIGYISLGSLNESVKAVSVDGVEPTVENIKSGKYSLARPFNVAIREDNSDPLVADFMAYVLSEEGQAIVEESGYIAIDGAKPFEGTQPEGSIVVGGSSSVSPVMEKLIEAYNSINKNATVEIQTSDSTTGMTNAAEGSYDIGMASRELKDSEKEAGLVDTVIATDGIAVIVNNENPVEDITKDTIKGIYTGEITTWADAQ